MDHNELSSSLGDRFYRSKDSFKIDIYKLEENKPHFAAYLKERCQVYMHLLSTKAISEDQMKVEFSIDILQAIFGNSNFDRFHGSDNSVTAINMMENLLKQNLQYFKILYPRNKRTQVSGQLITEIKDCDYLDKVQYDIMAQTKTLFQYKNQHNDSGTQILDQIRTFLNKIILSSRQDFNLFEKVLKVKILEKIPEKEKHGIEQIFNDGHKFKMGMKIPQDHMLLQDFGSESFKIKTTQMFRLIIKWIEDLAKLVEKKEQTISQRNYFKTFQIIGSQNRQLRLVTMTLNSLYNKKQKNQKQNIDLSVDLNHTQQKSKLFESNQQQNSENAGQESFFGSFIKKITNICSSEAYQTKIPRKIEGQYGLSINGKRTIPREKYGKNIEFTSFRYNVQGIPINPYLEALTDLNSNNEAEQFVKEQLQYLQTNYITMIKMAQKQKVTKNFTLEEKKIYSLSQYTYQFLRDMAAERLLNLIHKLVDFRYSSANKIGVKGDIVKECDLVSFKVTDMLRARIMANQNQILLIFKALQQLQKENQIHLVKVKNRFNEAMNDAIIIFQMREKSPFDPNVYYSSPVLCQYQLILSKSSHYQSAQSAKQKASESLNHYLYEIERSTYGPISELALIIATKDHRIDYLKKIKKKIPDQKIHLNWECFCGKGQMSESNKKKYDNFEYIEYFYDSKGIAIDMSFKNWKSSLPRPFLCNICQKVFGKVQNLFPIQICQQCCSHICSECQFAGDPQIQRLRYIKLLSAIVCSLWKDNPEQDQKVDYQQKMFFKKIQYKFDQKLTEITPQKTVLIRLRQKIIRFKVGDSKKKFWNNIKKQFQNMIKKNNYQEQWPIGILLKPSLAFSSENNPFEIISYNPIKKKIIKFYIQRVTDNSDPKDIMEEYDQQIQCKAFDACLFDRLDSSHGAGDVMYNFSQVLRRFNPFLKRRLEKSKEIDVQSKIRRRLEKAMNNYDSQIHLNDLFIKKIDFSRFKESYQTSLKNIKFLNLSGNKISKFEGLDFMESLQDLRISMNNIQQIQIKDDSYPNLQKLYVNQNDLKRLIIVNHKRIMILEAQNNQFFHIEIINLPNLSILNLSASFSNLKECITQKLPNLRSLNWSGLLVPSFYKNFIGLDYPQLTDLIIVNSNWQIEQFPPHLKLCKLEGIQNPIKLKKLNFLKHLELSRVRLQNFIFPPKCVKLIMSSLNFSGSNALPNFDGNTLKDFKFSCVDNASSESIQISNFLKSNLPNLQNLTFENIGTKQVNECGDFSKFKSLKKLEIKECLKQISLLPKNLQSLIIQNRQQSFKFNFEAVDDLKKLRKMDLKIRNLQKIKIPENGINIKIQQSNIKEIIKSNCSELESLEIIDIMSLENKQGLQESQFPMLQRLQICKSSISELCFTQKLKNLKILILKYNKILSMSWIPKEKLESLVQLNLENNQISSIQFFNSDRLERIYLKRNYLTKLKEDAKKLTQYAYKYEDLRRTLKVLEIFPILGQNREQIYADQYEVEGIQELYKSKFSLIKSI